MEQSDFKERDSKKSTRLSERIFLIGPAEKKGKLLVPLDCHGRSAKNGKREGK
jgi:hypothetical protein